MDDVSYLREKPGTVRWPLSRTRCQEKDGVSIGRNSNIMCILFFFIWNKLEYKMDFL